MSMFSTNGLLYVICTWIYRLMIMSVLGLLGCLLIVTVPASVAATVGLARRLIRGDDSSLVRQFFILFSENFKQSMVGGWILFVFGGLLLLDWLIILHLQSVERAVMSVLLYVIALLYAFILLNFFPLVVHTRLSHRQLLLSAIKLSLYKPYLTLLNLLSLLAMLWLANRLPILLFLIYPGAAAYVTYAFAQRKFRSLPSA